MVGACIFCGQVGAIDTGNQETANNIATNLCDCEDAKKSRKQQEFEEQQIKRRAADIEKACKTIKKMFSEDSEESHMEKTSDEVIEELMTISILIIDSKLNEVQIKLPTGVVGKISKKSNGNITIQKSKGIVMKQEI